MTLSHEPMLADALGCLKDAQKALFAEISGYPTPISGCDAQFNHLLSERHKIGEALVALGSTPFVATPRTPEQGARVESR